MKDIRTTIVTVAILTLIVFFGGSPVIADTVTLVVGAGGPSTQSYVVPSNVVAQVIFSALNTGGNGQNSGILRVSFPPSTFPPATNGLYYTTTPATPPLAFVGPAAITLNNSYSPLIAICTIQTSPASAANFTPSSSVVIPNDGAGPVTIILESSTDLINWTPAEPGTYGTTTSNRFFRVRAQR
jgi:hypothetical protein